MRRLEARSLIGLNVLVLTLVVFLKPGEASSITIIDSLGNCTLTGEITTDIQIRRSGSFGTSISANQIVGAEFTLTQPTVLTEIGAFVNPNCGFATNDPPCGSLPGGPPMAVQIHPANSDGDPDPDTVLAFFTLSNDGDPSVYSFESVTITLALEPGTYFALFVSQGLSQGIIGSLWGGRNTVIDPNKCRADSIRLGVLNPPTGLSSTFFGFAAVRVLSFPTPEPVSVDVKPKSCPNPLNVKSRGVLPVAILGTDSVDITQVDLATVQLEGVSPLRSAQEDVATPFEPFIGKEEAFDCTNKGPDGFVDLTLKFDTQEVIDALGPVTDNEVQTLKLTGNLLDGTPIIGGDVVMILNKKKK